MNSFEGLLSALAGVPVLRGARCRGRHHIFDPQGEREPDDVAQARHRQALALCSQCPALTDCATWFTSLPPRRRPPGVIAGQLHRPTKTANKAS